MSTRATIAFKRDDGRYAAIYLHFDGYPERTGVILNERYADVSATQKLVEGGDVRSFDDFGAAERYMDGNPPAIMPTHTALIAFARNCDTQYVYVFEENVWQCHKL